MAERTTLEATVQALYESKKYTVLREILNTMQPFDIAATFASLDGASLPLLFRLLPKQLAAETFVEMEPEEQELLIRGFSDAELKEVIDELYVDDAVDIIEEMPANVVSRILNQADPEMRKTINDILKYPEDSAGSIMTTEYVSLRPAMTAEEAIKRIRRTGVDKETIYTCYVTDENRHLLGYITLKSLLLADEDALVSDMMGEDIISAATTDDQEEVANNLSKYDLNAMPVVDKENRLVGIITIDDAIDVIEEETTEDMGIMAGISPTDKPYLRMSPWELWKARIPWLILLMISATFTGMIISSFEDALASVVILTAYIPMLMGTGGNSGSQASVTVIRALSLGDLDFSDLFRVVWKEMRVSLLCGVSLAAACFLKLIFIDAAILAMEITIPVAAVVSLTLLMTVIMAKLVGCVLPMLAQKLGFDPAVMASPFITTIVDALSLILYFQAASMLLGL